MVDFQVDGFGVDCDHETQVELHGGRGTRKTVEKAESPRQ